MKTGRNDPCPCGSGKKYKKCCLAKDQAAPETRPMAFTPAASVTESPAPESLLAIPREPGRPSVPPPPPRAPNPPPPPDPITERADQRWKEFESQSEDGRIAIFLATLQDPDIMEDSLAFEMLSRLRQDAMQRGDRARIPDFVAALHDRLPEVYKKSAHYYLSWCVQDALAENRLEAVTSLTRELAARAGGDIDIFYRTVEALAYHGQLSVLVEAFRIAWPGVKSSKNVVPWGVFELMNRGADYEIFDYLEHTESPDPTDPVLLDRVEFFAADGNPNYVSEMIGDLTGSSGREWQVKDFALRPPRKKDRGPWDDDEDEEEEKTPEPASKNLSRLIHEFVGYARREEGVPFPRGRLVGDHLYSYFHERHQGNLDPRPSMLEAAMNPNLKLPKPPRPAHPLCPERVTLDVFLGQMLGVFSMLIHASAALFQAMPAWLRFLESKRLIDADVRRKVANELLPLHGTLSKLWHTFHDDPTLYRQGQGCPADAARGPATSPLSSDAAEPSG